MKPHKTKKKNSRLTPRFKHVLVFACAGLLLLNGAVAWIQNELSLRAVSYIQDETASHGLRVENMSFRCSGFSALNTLQWKTLRGQVGVTERGAFSKDRSFFVTVRRLEAAWIGLFPPFFEISAEGIEVLESGDGEAPGERTAGTEKMTQGSLRFKTIYTFWNPGKSRREAGALFHQGLELIRQGKTPLQIDFKTTVYFKIHEMPIRASIESRRSRGFTLLRMPAQDLITISAVLAESLTSHEIQILSENPLRAPQLLKIGNYARTTAYQAAKKDKAIPKDAYRHVLWSYLLTREFGEVFSEKVTRAHEINSVLDNTAAQTAMDYKNNAIGRQYARLGYDEASILKRLMKDPAVVRYSTPQKERELLKAR